MVRVVAHRQHRVVEGPAATRHLSRITYHMHLPAVTTLAGEDSLAVVVHPVVAGPDSDTGGSLNCLVEMLNCRTLLLSNVSTILATTLLSWSSSPRLTLRYLLMCATALLERKLQLASRPL